MCCVHVCILFDMTCTAYYRDVLHNLIVRDLMIIIESLISN